MSLLQKLGNKIFTNVKTKEQYQHSRAEKTKRQETKTDHNVTDYEPKKKLFTRKEKDWSAPDWIYPSLLREEEASHNISQEFLSHQQDHSYLSWR